MTEYAKFINTKAGNLLQELELDPAQVRSDSGLIPVPDGAQVLVEWEHGEVLFYKDTEHGSYGINADPEDNWDWTYSTETVQGLRNGDHKASILWDIDNVQDSD